MAGYDAVGDGEEHGEGGLEGAEEGGFDRARHCADCDGVGREEDGKRVPMSIDGLIESNWTMMKTFHVIILPSSGVGVIFCGRFDTLDPFTFLIR